jgi:hypothetical protein
MKQQKMDSTWEKAKDVALRLAIAACHFALGVIACLAVQDFAAAVLA